MTTFSCCMIVKNEAKVLSRCLDSIADLMDEIIIVDTGSTDETKAIASKYTDKVYDFDWIDDFSSARNFSFSKATMDYIYVPDADEYLDDANHRQLALLKEYLDPQVDIVQMMYDTISDDTVLNIKKEYRPKLYKRLRQFTWIDPIHETVRLEPVVFDSDIVITHAPTKQSFHAKRDFGIFQKALLRDGELSRKVTNMYATELLKVGTLQDFEAAADYFKVIYDYQDDEDQRLEAACVLIRLARLKDDWSFIQKYTPAYPTCRITSEICYDLGMYYKAHHEYLQATDWFSLAIEETPYILDVHTSGDLPLKEISDCYVMLLEQNPTKENEAIYLSQARNYQVMLEDWSIPTEQPYD